MRLSFDWIALTALLTTAGLLSAHGWLQENPGYNPWQPLTLAETPGPATAGKFAALRSDAETCRAFLTRSGLNGGRLPSTGAGACQRTDRRQLTAADLQRVALIPGRAEGTCAIDAAIGWWLHNGVQMHARHIFASRVVKLEHLGTVNCRRIRPGANGRWSEHATGNAIDISAFILADGRRIEVRHHWQGHGKETEFLHAVRDSACQSFATVLSPDYNAAHADHLHFDQAKHAAGWRACH